MLTRNELVAALIAAAIIEIIKAIIWLIAR
jgi:hypothetical protein